MNEEEKDTRRLERAPEVEIGDTLSPRLEELLPGGITAVRAPRSEADKKELKPRLETGYRPEERKDLRLDRRGLI